MTFAEAMSWFQRETGWSREDIQRDPSSAAWIVHGRAVEASRVIEARQR